MLSYKSAVVYSPGPGNEKFCDNYYFNLKTISPDSSMNAVRLAQKTAKGGKQLFAVATGLYSPEAGREAVDATFNKLKKYHAFFLKNSDTEVSNLVRNFFSDAAQDISRTIKNDDEIFTKVSCALLCTDEEKITAANVGCVKIYSIKGSAVTEITTEHTQAMKMVSMGVIPIAKLKGHPQRKKLVKYLGVNREASVPDINTFSASDGETIVILGSSFADTIEKNTLIEAAKYDEPGDAATHILNANLNSSAGDYTVIVIKCCDSGTADETVPVTGVTAAAAGADDGAGKKASKDQKEKKGFDEDSAAAEAAAIAAAEAAARLAAEERTKQEERARLEKERLEKEQAERARLEKERLEKEQAEKERLEREQAEKERLERERLEREQAERERLEEERLERERAEKERLELEKIEKERAEKERLETERLEAERAEKERSEKERAEKERLEQEKLEKERAEKERIAIVLAEQKRREQEKLEKEKAEKERLERERAEKERLKREKAEKEKAERERIAAEKSEKERLRKEQTEKE
ncbi:MAG: hypothetical protein J6112_00530, partial [Clostridia bacterium]|nr:hypothetical protein [Clostridia bacterium]